MTYEMDRWVVNGESVPVSATVSVVANSNMSVQVIYKPKVEEPKMPKTSGWVQSELNESVTITVKNKATSAISTLTAKTDANGNYVAVIQLSAGKYTALASISQGAKYLTAKSATATFTVNADATITVSAYKQARGINIFVTV